MEINGRPLGSGVLCRLYTMPERKSGIILAAEDKKFMPVVEVLKTGSKCVEVKEGQWAFLIQGRLPNVFCMAGERLALFKEYDFEYVYDTKPDFDEVMGNDTAITRDLTDYVDVEKMSKLKVKFSTSPGLTDANGQPLN